MKTRNAGTTTDAPPTILSTGACGAPIRCHNWIDTATGNQLHVQRDALGIWETHDGNCHRTGSGLLPLGRVDQLLMCPTGRDTLAWVARMLDNPCSATAKQAWRREGPSARRRSSTRSPRGVGTTNKPQTN